MKRFYLFLVMAVVLSLAWLPACQSPDASGPTENDLETRTQEPNLDDPYGGFNLADEAPGFDDPVLLNEFDDSKVAEYNDPVSQQPDIAAAIKRPLPQHYLMITWGNLERDSLIDYWTEWRGSLTVDQGAILLKRIIRFEGRDQILPRTARNKLEWISNTGPGFDGIVVRILPRRDICADSSVVDTACVANMVTFDTGPLTVSFTLAELRDIHRIIRVDNMGNAVSFNSIIVYPNSCPRGFLGGIWKDNPDTTGGTFRGMWMSEKGAHMGFLRGIYGVNSAGDRVFFGKWVSMNGKFKGILKGHYGNFPDAPGGFFEGVYLSRSLRIRGDLKGVWQKSDRLNGGGFFKGRWANRCPAITPN
jgi:hypothetical protein